MGIDGDRSVLRTVSEVLGHGRPIHDLAWIHPVVRIECSFDLAECFINLRSEKFLVQMTPCQSISMLPAHASAEFDHQIGNLARHLLHYLKIPRVLCIDQGANMEAADTGVAVIACARFVFFNDASKPEEE